MRGVSEEVVERGFRRGQWWWRGGRVFGRECLGARIRPCVTTSDKIRAGDHIAGVPGVSSA